MHLIASSCRLAKAVAALPDLPYGAARSAGKEGEPVLPALVSCVLDTLASCGRKAEDIDLIVSLSLSPDHLVSNSCVMGPRVGHPLQRELGAENAFVFDAMDSSLAKTLYMVNTLSIAQGYCNVLIVRSENTVHLRACPETGFSIANGAAAMLLAPDPDQYFTSRSVSSASSMLRVDLNTHIKNAAAKKGAFKLAYQPELLDEINRDVDRVLSDPRMGVGEPCVESWLQASNNSKYSLGPFEAFAQLSGAGDKESGKREVTAITSVDLFAMEVHGVTLRPYKEVDDV